MGPPWEPLWDHFGCTLGPPSFHWELFGSLFGHTPENEAPTHQKRNKSTQEYHQDWQTPSRFRARLSARFPALFFQLPARSSSGVLPDVEAALLAHAMLYASCSSSCSPDLLSGFLPDVEAALLAQARLSASRPSSRQPDLLSGFLPDVEAALLAQARLFARCSSSCQTDLLSGFLSDVEAALLAQDSVSVSCSSSCQPDLLSGFLPEVEAALLAQARLSASCNEVEAARSAARDRYSGKLLAVPLASSFANAGLELTVFPL